MDDFGSRLKRLIKSSDIKTVKGFADKAGIHENSISRILTGKNKPSFEVIETCLNVFDSEDFLWLMSGDYRKTKLEFENEQLKREVAFYRKKTEAIAKPSSNRISPRLPFPEYSLQNSVVLV
jgi:transcriptional regulator with XRE-family HTH domain